MWAVYAKMSGLLASTRTHALSSRVCVGETALDDLFHVFDEEHENRGVRS